MSTSVDNGNSSNSQNNNTSQGYGFVGPAIHMMPVTYYVMSNGYESYYVQYHVMDVIHDN